MMSATEFAFDQYAGTYDAVFTDTVVGQAQRDQVWRCIDGLNLPAKLRILELNCGTGKDAAEWAKRGARVLATDISVEMVNVARSNYPGVYFDQLDIRQSGSHMHGTDLIFSNFGGFNCLCKEELQTFFNDAATHLPENGSIVLVVMGKKCIWDRLYLTLKGRWSAISRRNIHDGVAVPVAEETITTWYYSPGNIRKLLPHNLKIQALKPIGLFVPPSYMAPLCERQPGFFSLLKAADKYIRPSFMANYADHFFIHITKNSNHA